MSLQLDRTDVEILELLQEDGRMMYKDIANRVGVSLPTVRARLKRLLDLGVVRKFTVIIDPDKIYGKIRTIFLLQAEPTHIDEICTKLAEIKEVREVYVVAGTYTVVAKIEVRDIAELGDMTTRKLPSLAGVQNLACLVLTRTAKEEYGASVTPEAMVQFRCEFCRAPILGKPLVEIVDGVRYYFSGEACLRAFRERHAQASARARQPSENLR